MAGMGGTNEAQLRAFEARLKRINKGGPNTAGHVIIGPQDPTAKKPRARRIRRPGDFLSRLGGAFAHLLLVPVAFALGAVAMMSGIVGAVQIGRLPLRDVAEAGLVDQLMPYSEFVIAGVVALLFGLLFRLMHGPRKLALAMGLAAAFLLQDSVIETYPDVFAVMMSDEPLSLPQLADLTAL
jgi:hypothetical protein